MESFYFEKPSIKRKKEIIEFLDEFVKYESDINGSGSLDKIYDGYTFEEADNETMCDFIRPIHKKLIKKLNDK